MGKNSRNTVHIIIDLSDGAPLWDNARSLGVHALSSIITPDNHVNRTGLTSSHVSRDQYPWLGR